jgi:hypothetical protein
MGADQRASLASADALDFGRVQRVDLWPALTLLLMANRSAGHACSAPP